MTNQQNPMTNDQSSTGATSKKKIPWQVIIIMAVTIVPIIAAYVAYYTGIGVPEGQVNKGILLQPGKQVSTILSLAQGDLPGFEKNDKWRIFIPISANCSESCKKNLYTTRQVHKRLAQRAGRVERYLVNLNGENGLDFADSLKQDHPLLKVFSLSSSDWQQWLKETNAPKSLSDEPYYILVSQYGDAMMYYTTSHEGGELLTDIKRVLRYSPEIR